MRKNKTNKILKTIQIDIREDRNEDVVFSKLYDLINNGKKKDTINKALMFLLKKGNEEVLEILFGDNLEEAKIIARKRVPRAKKVMKKRVKTKNTPSIQEKFKELYSNGFLTKSDKIEIGIKLESEENGSSTTKDIEGENKEFFFKKKKKKNKQVEVSADILKANKERFLKEAEEQQRIRDDKKKENMVKWKG